MPIYEYRCERGHMFEVLQRMSDDPPSTCSSCEATVTRVLNPVAVHFKGSGFYTTDYARKGRGSGDSTDGKGADSSSSDSSKGSSESKGGSESKGSSDTKSSSSNKESSKAGSSSGSSG